MSNERYFNIPIQLLGGFMINSHKVLNDITDYAIYENATKLEVGTPIEKIKDSSNFLGLKVPDEKKTYNNGKALFISIPENSPKVGLNYSIFWDFYKNEKSEFDKICFLAFLSIKSMIGSKPYYKATNLFLWARMDGKIKTIVDINELSVEVRKFVNEYQTTKIKTALRNSWGLVHYARYTRGFYVSFRFTLKELIREAEKRRISTKEKGYKETEKLALKEVLEQLKTTRPTTRP